MPKIREEQRDVLNLKLSRKSGIDGLSKDDEEFRRIAGEIARVTKVSLDFKTLRRICGQYQLYRPNSIHKITADAIVRFLGVRQWEDIFDVAGFQTEGPRHEVAPPSDHETRVNVIGALMGNILRGLSVKGYKGSHVLYNLKNPETESFTSDVVMAMAVMEWLTLSADDRNEKALVRCMREWYDRYRTQCWFGKLLTQFFEEENSTEYGSWGDGAVSRAVAIGFAATTLRQCKALALTSADVTHNTGVAEHAVQAISEAVFMARHGAFKDTIAINISNSYGYDLVDPLSQIEELRRRKYNQAYKQRYMGAQQVARQALIVFLASKDFMDAIALSSSLPGDVDTRNQIVGALAAAYYKYAPTKWYAYTVKKMPWDMRWMVEHFQKYCVDGDERENMNAAEDLPENQSRTTFDLTAEMSYNANTPENPILLTKASDDLNVLLDDRKLLINGRWLSLPQLLMCARMSGRAGKQIEIAGMDLCAADLYASCAQEKATVDDFETALWPRQLLLWALWQRCQNDDMWYCMRERETHDASPASDPGPLSFILPATDGKTIVDNTEYPSVFQEWTCSYDEEEHAWRGANVVGKCLMQCRQAIILGCQAGVMVEPVIDREAVNNAGVFLFGEQLKL